MTAEYKAGNEFLPYHPQASHVSPDYRDGWNACYRAAMEAQAPAEGDEPYSNAAFERGYQQGRQQERQLQEARQFLAAAHGIEVSVGRMSESNGRVTWMVMLHRQGDQTLLNGHQVYSSHIEGRAQYEAAALRHFLGQGPEPDILDYDTDGAAQADVQPKGTPPLPEELGQWLTAIGELYIAMGRPPFEATEPTLGVVETLREAAKRLAAQAPAPAHGGPYLRKLAARLLTQLADNRPRRALDLDATRQLLEAIAAPADADKLIADLTRKAWEWGVSCEVDDVRWGEVGDSHNQMWRDDTAAAASRLQAALLTSAPSPAVKDEHPAWELPTPAVGDYVLATKYSDGDPGDAWAIGFYTHSDTLQGNEQTRRHYVADSAGKNIRGNGFRKVHGPIRGDVGRWLLEVASKQLEASPPGVVNLWTMLTPFAFDLERDREPVAHPPVQPMGGA